MRFNAINLDNIPSQQSNKDCGVILTVALQVQPEDKANNIWITARVLACKPRPELSAKKAYKLELQLIHQYQEVEDIPKVTST